MNPLELFNGDSASKAKLYLDTLDFNGIIDVWDQLTEQQLYAYFTGLTDADW